MAFRQLLTSSTLTTCTRSVDLNYSAEGLLADYNDLGFEGKFTSQLMFWGIT